MKLMIKLEIIKQKKLVSKEFFNLGVTSEKKNRRFKDIYQIGEGGSSSNQKFKMILISDIF